MYYLHYIKNKHKHRTLIDPKLFINEPDKDYVEIYQIKKVKGEKDPHIKYTRIPKVDVRQIYPEDKVNIFK